MILHKIIHTESGLVIGSRVEIATGLKRRTIGLMFRQTMGDIDGLVIERCNSVHTCFQRFAMDAVFLSPNYTIVKIIRNMKPWRFTTMYFKAVRVLELPAGTVPVHIKEGTKLEVIRV